MARADGLSGPVRPGGGSGQGSSGGGSASGGSASGGMGGARGAGRPPGSRRAPRRLRFIFAGLLLLLLLEIIVLITVGNAIGPWWTLGLLLLFVVAGLYLVRRESGRTWKALRQAVDTGKMPGRELADASLVLLGGFFLLLPGFLSDIVGIFLILPFTRTLSRRLLAVLIGSRMPPMTVSGFPAAGAPGGHRPGTGTGGTGSTQRGDDIIEGEIVDEDPPAGR